MSHVLVRASGRFWSATPVHQRQEQSPCRHALVTAIAPNWHRFREAARNCMDIVACVCGGEAGVDLADALSEYLGLLSNGTAVANRRDKKVQQELTLNSGRFFTIAHLRTRALPA